MCPIVCRKCEISMRYWILSLYRAHAAFLSLSLSLTRSLLSRAAPASLASIPYSCELWYRIQGRLVWCSGQLWRPLRESFRAWCFGFTTNISSRVDGRTVRLILQFLYFAGFVPNPGSSPAVFSNMAQIFLQYCFQTWPLRKIFAKIETLRVGNVASCSEFLYTKSVVTHNDIARWYTWKPNHLLETQSSWILTLLKILYGCVKIRYFLQENQTIYYNPSNYCRNSNVSVTGWFIYSDRHQGGNYLKWRSLFFFPSTFFLRNLFSKCST